MKYRKDITDFAFGPLHDICGIQKKIKFYVMDGIVYEAHCCWRNPRKILYYVASTRFDFNREGLTPLKQKIEKEFEVKFIEKEEIVCRCGKGNAFSASYGSYELNLRCNVCGRFFTAYAG